MKMDQCMAALQRQDERNQKPQVYKCSRSLSESRIGTGALSSDNCEQYNHINTDLNRSMHPFADVSFSQCGNCKRSNGIIEDLMKSIIELSDKQDVILNRLAKAEDAIHQHLEGEFTPLRIGQVTLLVDRNLDTPLHHLLIIKETISQTMRT